MAHYDKEEKRIITTVEDEENFQEAHHLLSTPKDKRRYKGAERMLYWVKTGKLLDDN